MTLWHLQRGRVIDPRHGVDAVMDVVLRDGKVAELSAKPLTVEGATKVDAKGQ
jgi:dihydroorotase